MDRGESGLEDKQDNNKDARIGRPSKIWCDIENGDLDPKEVHPRRLPGCSRDGSIVN